MNLNNICIAIITSCVIIGTFLAVASKFVPEVEKEICEQKYHGVYRTYECYDGGSLNRDCSKYMTGNYCDDGQGRVFKINLSQENLTMI